MRKLIISTISAGLILSGFSIAQEEKCEMCRKNMMEMKDKGMQDREIMRVMMMDPEIRKIMMKQMKKCRQEMMKKVMSNPEVIKKMLNVIIKHREITKQVLNENPDLRDHLKELLNN